MNWRRFLWLSLSALLAWGLYLHLPPKPRWTLPLPEVPLHVNSGRMLTVGVDTKKHNYTHKNYGWKGADLFGPILLRDLASGTVLGSALAQGEPLRLYDYSEDLRFVCVSVDRGEKNFVIHDLESGARWDGYIEGFSPRVSLIAVRKQPVVVHSDSKVQLRDTATGAIVTELGGEWSLVKFDPNDRWALFQTWRENEDAYTARFLFWQRTGNVAFRSEYPGWLRQSEFTSNGETAALLFTSPACLVLWDVLAGKARLVLKTALLDDDQRNAFLKFSPDGRTLAVWAQDRDGLELFETATGTRTFESASAAPWLQHSRERTHAYSPDSSTFFIVEKGNEFNEPEWIAAFDIVSKRLRWRRRVDRESLWLDLRGILPPLTANERNDDLLIVQDANPNVTRPSLFLSATTGEERFRRIGGDVSLDQKYLIADDYPFLSNTLGLPDALVQWLPGFADRQMLRVRVQAVESGEIVFQRLHEGGHGARCLYPDEGTLVLVILDQGTEVWDLPPARRWIWIVGPPVAVVALPWLWRFKSRKKASPNLTPVTQPTASLPSTPAPAHPSPPSY